MSESIQTQGTPPNAQQTDITKSHGKFGKRPIACITAGALLSLTGIGLLIGIPLVVIGVRRLLNRKAEVLKTNANQANKNEKPVEGKEEVKQDQVKEEWEINASSSYNEQNVINEGENQQAQQQQESQQQANENKESINEGLKQNEVNGNEQPVQEEKKEEKEIDENEESIEEKEEVKQDQVQEEEEINEEEKEINESSNNNKQNAVIEKKNQQAQQQQESQQQADENEEKVVEDGKIIKEDKEPVEENKEVEEEQENDINLQSYSQENSSSTSNDTGINTTQPSQNIETNQNANSSDTSPQPTGSTTNEALTVTIQPGEGYDDAANGAVNFVKDNPENIATCMADDGTRQLALDQKGNFLINEDNNTSIKSINTAKKLTDDELKRLINGNAEKNAEFKATQAWKDFERNCHTFNIYGIKLTHDVTQGESYEDFMKRVADAIKEHEAQKLNKQEGTELTNDQKELIEEKQIKFFRQIFKYPGQALTGGAATIYQTFFTFLDPNKIEEGNMLCLKQADGLNFKISLTENDTITIKSTYKAVIMDIADLIKTEQNIANFPNRLCVEEKIIATIPLSEGENGNDSKFTVNKNTTTFFRADAHDESGDNTPIIDTSRIKSVIRMEYINENNQSHTFTIKEPIKPFGRLGLYKTVKKLHLSDGEWKNPEKLEEQDSNDQ